MKSKNNIDMLQKIKWKFGFSDILYTLSLSLSLSLI